MQTATATPMSQMTSSAPGWFARGVGAIDNLGRGAWIALTIAGFVFAGPLGFVVGGFALFSGRFAKGNGRGAFRGCRSAGARMSMGTTGNAAFDAYRDETLRRLEDEQRQFETFLERLREAKDKAEFDQFMDERAKAARDAGSNGDDDGGKDAA